jgi:MFS family permease
MGAIRYGSRDGSTRSFVSTAGTGRAARARALVVDVTPLRLDGAFRRLWVSQGSSALGREAAKLALPLHVFLLTDSAAAVGILSAVQLLPALTVPLLGGALADAYDRRRILVLTQLLMALIGAALAVISLLPEPPVVLIMLCGGLLATLFGIEHPARIASIPRLTHPERLRAALALSSLSFQVAAIVGPAVAGLLIAFAGVPAGYALIGIVYLVAAVGSARLPSLPAAVDAVRPSFSAVREGIRFVRSRRVVLSTFAIDLNAMIFGLPIAVLPVLAIQIFGIGPAGVGLLAAARGAGALAAAVFSGWVSGVSRIGRAVIWIVMIYAVVTCIVGLSAGHLWLAIIAIVVAGATDVMSAVLRASIVQHVTPDALRGRVTAIHVLLVSSGPRIGDVRATFMAEAIGAQGSVVVGGLIAIAGVGLVARWFPELGRYTDREPAGDAERAPATA